MEFKDVSLLDIREIAERIKKGEIVIFPTDTVYGILADATNKKAVNSIFKIKKRPKEKPLPLFVSGIEMAKNLAFINKSQEEFLKKVWPGKVTAVLKARNKNRTIGLRQPDYKKIIDILKIIKVPLAQTSANISGNPPSVKISEVIKQFEGERILAVDAGNIKKNKPSSVIDLTGEKIKILRK